MVKNIKGPNGAIIYKGPSLFDGAPIVCIAVGLRTASKNTKTGGMLQTYIIRARISPLDASKSGRDFSICGTCPHRGTPTKDTTKKQAARRTCYVNLGQGPTGVYRAYRRGGRYPDMRAHVADVGRGRYIRIGTYGDPAAVPAYVWKSLLKHARGHTGYTHAIDTPGAAARPDFCMISADSLPAARAQWQKGRRTFRIGHAAAGDGPVPGREILCPASKEAGFKTTCENCRLCSGAELKAKSIFIFAHGSGANYFTQGAA